MASLAKSCGQAIRSVVFIGPPGSGKGTYAKLLSQRLKLEHISTGDVLRQEIAANTAIGVKAKEYTSHGKHVPQEIVDELLFGRLCLASETNGFILDGYPRTKDQAIALNRVVEIERVVHIKMRGDILIRKMLGRRVCSECGVSWNIENVDEDGIYMPPLLPTGEHNGHMCGVDCMSKLEHRTDDMEDVIKHRQDEYKVLEAGILDFYANTNVISVVEIAGGVERMLPDFLRAVQ